MPDRRTSGITPSSIAKAAGIVLIPAVFFVLIHYRNDLQQAYSLYRIQALIRSSQSQSRNTLGRLSTAPHGPLKAGVVPDDLVRAQIMLLSLPNSERSDYLQGLIDIGTNKWEHAAETLTRLASVKTSDARIANDLGVVFFQLSQHDAIYVFRALDQFEWAEKLNPKAAEPHYNRLLLLRELQLKKAEENERAQYSKLETAGLWFDELFRQPIVDEEKVAAQLQNAIDREDNPAATAVFTSYPEICRKIAMRYATDPVQGDENEKVAAFIGEMIEKNYADETVLHMLSALKNGNRSELVQARKLVAQGADFYLKTDLKRSLEAYNNAEQLVARSDSTFDHVWLDLNRAITEIRLAQVDSARSTLDHVVAEARAKNLKWILASALSTYGSTRSLNASFTEMMDRLEEAVRICDEIEAPKTSARARFYMLGQRKVGGDLDGALQIALRCLKVTEPSDHLRLASTLSDLDVILYKKGFLNQAVTVGQEAVSQATESRNPSIIVGASTTLALINELNGNPQSADSALGISESAIKGMNPEDRVRSEISINNMKARMLLDRGDIVKAQTLLEQNRAEVVVTYLKAETWSLLGQAYLRNKQFAEAGKILHEAVDFAEQDNSFAKSDPSRVAFDDARRELYDSAIGFEYAQGSTDEAWTYLQKYRAKLFIEMLAQFNPEIQKIHSIAMDRSQVQKAVPEDVQILEYALLPDRLLIWVVTDKQFQTRSVSINRDSIEQKIQAFLANLRAAKPASESTDLYNILVAPVADLLDAKRTLAIIPDRALHGLPFAALQSPAGKYLIQLYAMIESPTLTHLLAVSPGKLQRDSIVAFGSRSEDVAESREIGAMKAVYRKMSSFTGQQVSKATFLQELEHAEIFHYAGHSAHDAVDPLRSAILLDGEKGGPNNVTAVDIVAHQLRPNAVVILSSCDSSIGNSKDGIGIRGLTSAFLVRGAGAVVGSLWPVESTSTSELMRDFHKAFAGERLPIAQALRKAQLSLLESNPRRAHPYYWSGFVVTSNFSALR